MIIGQARAANPVDPFFSSVVFLASFEMADASGASYTEQSSFHATVTFSTTAGSDGASQSNISTTQFEYGAASARSNNTTGATVPDSANWDISDANSSPYTIEYSFYQTERVNNYGIFIRNPSAGQRAILIRHNGTAWEFFYSADGTNFNSTSAATAITSGNMSAWTKYAICKNASGKIRMFVNGVMVASDTPADSTIFHSTSGLGINTSAASQTAFLDNARITKGVCRYDSDSNYTLATAAFPTQ